MSRCQTGIIPLWSTWARGRKGLMLAMAYSVTGLTCAGRGSVNSSTGVEGVLGVESCTKRKRIALSSGQNHLSPNSPATKMMTTTTPMM
jgi:hypothetical protein